MRALMSLLLVLCVSAPAVAGQSRLTIDWQQMQPSASDTSQAYSLPTGANELWMHFSGQAAEYRITVQYRVGQYPWMTAVERYEINAPEGATFADAPSNIDDSKRFQQPAFPPDSQYRFILRNLSTTVPCDFKIDFGYTVPDEQH